MAPIIAENRRRYDGGLKGPMPQINVINDADGRFG